MEHFKPITAKAARVNAGLSTQEASNKIGVSRATLNNYEAGRTSPPWEIVEKMSVVYKYPKSGLLFTLQTTKSGGGEVPQATEGAPDAPG